MGPPLMGRRSETLSGRLSAVLGLVAQASEEPRPPAALSVSNGILRKFSKASKWMLSISIFTLAIQMPLCLPALKYPEVLSVMAARGIDKFFDHPLMFIALSTHLMLGIAIFYVISWLHHKGPAYLIDFYTFRGPDHLSGSNAEMVEGYCHAVENLTEKSKEFIRRVAEMSGLGDATFGSEAILSRDRTKPIEITFEGIKSESEMVLNASIQHLLAQTNTNPHEIDALIVNNCSWSPVPSLASFVVNTFKFKSTCLTYNLSGMGCTATAIATHLAQELLQNHSGMRILIASTENLTNSVYLGNGRSFMIVNLIFRLGGVAFLMSNHKADKGRAKYRLSRVVRTHMGADDAAYGCILQRTDDDGLVGVKIGKELMGVAGRALRAHITTLAPLVLPLSEKIAFAANCFLRKVLHQDVKAYSPDFTTAFEHFCIHTGGKVVLDTVSDALKLQPKQAEPCRATFHRFGNLSAASTWYNWSYIETKQGVRQGDRIWQLSFGSGFKVCSATWVALRKIDSQHDAWTETPSC